MGADFCFRMGANHTICQDYAASGTGVNGHPYALVSDGCSGSAFTDYGSRFLVQAARLHLTTPHFSVNVPLDSLEHGYLLSDARLMAQAAGLPRQCLDATLIRAMVMGDEIWVHHSGDGVIAARKRDTGAIEFVSTHFGENMPYYLSYRLDPNEERKYIERAKTWSQTLGRRVGGSLDRAVFWQSDTESDKPLNRHILVGELRYGPEYDLVLIMTDGAESFQTLGGDPIALTHVLDQLFDIKSYEGAFITRRCNRFLGRFCTEQGWKHTDDIAVAGIYRP